MNASFIYLARNLAWRRTRTVVGVLGIFLTLAFLAVIQIGLDSIAVSYIDLVALQADRADLMIRAPSGDPLNPQAFLGSEVTAKLAGNPNLLGVSPRLLGMVQLQYRGEDYAVLIGVDPVLEHQFDLWGLVPEPKLDDETFALSKTLVKKLNIAPGGKAVIRDPKGYEELQIARQLGMNYEVRLPKAEAITAFQNFASPLRAVFGVFALLTLVITGLLIYSLISVSVEERIREYAILRTLGAKRREVFSLVLGESSFLCLLGVIPGVAAGVVLAKILTFLLGLAFGAKASIPVQASLSTLGLAVAGGFDFYCERAGARIPGYPPEHRGWPRSDAPRPVETQGR